MMRNRRAQTLLLGVAIFPAQFCIIAERNQQFVHMRNDALFNGGVDAGADLIQVRHTFSLTD
ncbi:hypothetical protein D3C73_1667880 [compost metagenome]